MEAGKRASPSWVQGTQRFKDPAQGGCWGIRSRVNAVLASILSPFATLPPPRPAHSTGLLGRPLDLPPYDRGNDAGR
jgi:hypothetical protein